MFKVKVIIWSHLAWKMIFKTFTTFDSLNCLFSCVSILCSVSENTFFTTDTHIAKFLFLGHNRLFIFYPSHCSQYHQKVWLVQYSLEKDHFILNLLFVWLSVSPENNFTNLATVPSHCDFISINWKFLSTFSWEYSIALEIN